MTGMVHARVAPRCRTRSSKLAAVPAQPRTADLDRELMVIENHIARAMRSLDPNTYRPLLEFVSRPGKRLRARLVLTVAAALRADVREAFELGALVELLHTFSLIHDDVEDDSRLRRGAPALHIQCGVAAATNFGDALFTTLWENLIELSLTASVRLQVQRCFLRACTAAATGQAVELGWRDDPRVRVNENAYVDMVLGKTGAVLGLACELAAVAAESCGAADLRRYGEHLGVAFQIRDDVLNATCKRPDYGKEHFEDLRERKQTLPLIHLLAHGRCETSRELRRYMSGECEAPPRSAVTAALRECGAFDYATRVGARHVELAIRCLETLPAGPDRERLQELASYALARTR